MATKTKAQTPTTQKLGLEAQVEALLFVAPGMVTTNQIAAALEVPPREVEKALGNLEAGYGERGLRLQRHKNELRLVSSAEAASLVERFLDLEATWRLSSAALEVLSIVAYRQPITHPQVDAIRGVNSDSSLRSLLTHGLIEESGRAEGPGRPILYATTPEFLQHFGLGKLEELPPLNLDFLAKQEKLPEVHELKE